MSVILQILNFSFKFFPFVFSCLMLLHSCQRGLLLARNKILQVFSVMDYRHSWTIKLIWRWKGSKRLKSIATCWFALATSKHTILLRERGCRVSLMLRSYSINPTGSWKEYSNWRTFPILYVYRKISCYISTCRSPDQRLVNWFLTL